MKWHSEDLETVSCDLCGSSSVRHIFGRDDGLNAVECSECGLCFISPRPKPDLIYRLYDKNYFKKHAPSSDIGFSDYLSDSNTYGMLKTSLERLNIFKNITGIQPKKCLEIGCATGEFCHVLRQTGASIVGIDLSEFAIAQAKKRYPDSDFHNGDIEILGNNEQFDAIFAFELIEHVLSPKLFLKNVKKHLKQDGFLIISTPNYECGKKTGVEQWSGFATSFEHLYFFTPTILSHYAQKQGLSVVKWLTGGGVGTVTNLSKRQLLRQLLKNLIEKAKLLNFVRSVRDKLYNGEHSYQDSGNQHNLLMILRN